MKYGVFAAAAAVMVTGLAYAKEPCLQRSMIGGWGARDSHTLVVDDNFGKKYLLTVAGWCQDLEFGMGLSIHSTFGNAASCISRGDWVVPHGGGVIPARGARCTITKIELYTKEMEKAYRDAKAAKKAAMDGPPNP